MGKPAIFTSKLEAGPQGRDLTSKCTSAKPGMEGKVGKQEGLYSRDRTAGEPQAFP